MGVCVDVCVGGGGGAGPSLTYRRAHREMNTMKPAVRTLEA